MIDLEKMAKEHEKLFPNASLESQAWKLEEEFNECNLAEEKKKKIKEFADILIVCGGLYRWCPILARTIAKDAYRKSGYNEIEESVLDEEVNRKWNINLGRKWEWNGKTYKHVGKDGNE